MEPRRGPKRLFQPVKLGRSVEIAWEAVLSIVVGAVLGIFVDRHAGTSPLWLTVFLALGLATAIRRLLVFAKAETAAQKNARTPPPDARDDDSPHDAP